MRRAHECSCTPLARSFPGEDLYDAGWKHGPSCHKNQCRATHMELQLHMGLVAWSFASVAQMLLGGMTTVRLDVWINSRCLHFISC